MDVLLFLNPFPIPDPIPTPSSKKKKHLKPRDNSLTRFDARWKNHELNSKLN